MHYKINKSFVDFEAFVKQLPQIFSSEGTTLYEGRNTVKSFDVNGTQLVVKRFKRPNIVQCISYTFFKKSKAERAFLFAAELRNRGFNTPHEVAYIEMKSCGLLRDSYFVSTPCTLPPLSGLLRREDFDHDMADQLASLLVNLHERGALHGDLNLTNILYDTLADGTTEFWLIDTNRSTFKTPTKRDCIENLTRLTHEKPLLSYVVGRYAEKRGWDVSETIDDILLSLEKFEHKKRRIRRLKRFFRGEWNKE